jgi:hypothetical protein
MKQANSDTSKWLKFVLFCLKVKLCRSRLTAETFKQRLQGEAVIIGQNVWHAEL